MGSIKKKLLYLKAKTDIVVFWPQAGHHACDSPIVGGSQFVSYLMHINEVGRNYPHYESMFCELTY